MLGHRVPYHPFLALGVVGSPLDAAAESVPDLTQPTPLFLYPLYNQHLTPKRVPFYPRCRVPMAFYPKYEYLTSLGKYVISPNIMRRRTGTNLTLLGLYPLTTNKSCDIMLLCLELASVAGLRLPRKPTYRPIVFTIITSATSVGKH